MARFQEFILACVEKLDEIQFDRRKISQVLGFSLIALLLLSACGRLFGPSPTPEGEEVQAIPSATPTPVPTPTPIPRVLTICLGSEPEDLIPFNGGNLAKSHVMAAIYDGPIDGQGFEFKPIILEKLPNLEAGDARIDAVQVGEGDWVVDAFGDLVQLALGDRVRPSDCDREDCAVTWEGEPLSMAQLSATFTLLPGIKWSDGQPLTSKDSLFGYQVARQCLSNSAAVCRGFGLNPARPETVERTASYLALDERNLRWTGVPGFLDPDYPANFFFPLPEHILGQQPVAELITADTPAGQPLGWGPYALSSWQPGERIVLAKNQHYFRGAEGLPRFDELVFRFVGQDPAQNLAALGAGECEALDQQASLALAHQERATTLDLHERGEIVAHFTPSAVWEQLVFGIQPVGYDDGFHPWMDRPDFFGDERTRQAFALCLDRSKIVVEVLDGLSLTPQSYLHPDHPLSNPSITSYDHDTEAGMILLAEVGWVALGDPQLPRIARGIPNVPDGTPFSVSMLTSTATQRLQTADIIVESLAQCGIQVEIQASPAAEIYAPGPEGPVFGRRFDLALVAWQAGERPACDLFSSHNVPGPPEGTWNPLRNPGERDFPFGWGGLNAAGFSHPDYDQACRSALEALPGQSDFLEKHNVTQEIFAQQLPVLPLFLYPRLAIAIPELSGLDLDPLVPSEMWNIEAFDRLD
jgi:peptide/nickel transport system substrate-binding protein